MAEAETLFKKIKHNLLKCFFDVGDIHIDNLQNIFAYATMNITNKQLVEIRNLLKFSIL